MESIDKVLEALSVVERYEEYLFHRAWGRALTIIGTVLPLGVFINMNIQILASSMGLDTALILLIANVITIFLCWSLVLSVFFSAWRTVSKDPEQKSSGAKHGPVIAIIWFAAFILTNFLPEQFAVVSLLWASSIASLLSYLTLRITGSHIQERVMLYLGIMIGVVSLPLLLIADVVLAGYLALVAFSGCFIVAGLIMHQFANRTLKRSE
ncbi:MAG: hypothetical protein KAU48_14785 [Candidatus Thorarchaeota archaeon]|nr:hypothetical protein [Candidatus Thorarchaeota archaeon]